MVQSQTAIHPGVILEKDFLKARSVTQYRLAVDTSVPPRRINEIVHGKRGITADTALRLARYFGNDPLYWMQLQARWDLHRTRLRLGSRLTDDVRIPGEKAPSTGPRSTSAELPTADPAPDTPATPSLAEHLL